MELFYVYSTMEWRVAKMPAPSRWELSFRTVEGMGMGAPYIWLATLRRTASGRLVVLEWHHFDEDVTRALPAIVGRAQQQLYDALQASGPLRPKTAAPTPPRSNG